MTLELKTILIGTKSINHKIYWKDIIWKSMPQSGKKCMLFIYPTKEPYLDRPPKISKMKDNPKKKKKGQET